MAYACLNIIRIIFLVGVDVNEDDPAISSHRNGLIFCNFMRTICARNCLKPLNMETRVASTRKRPVNLTMNEALVAQAKVLTNNLSATMESLLAEFVDNQQRAQRNRQQVADVCAADWNAVHAAVGSFADEHSTL